MNMRAPDLFERDGVDRLIDDLVQAHARVRRCQARWEDDAEAQREKDAALAALKQALAPAAAPAQPEPAQGRETDVALGLPDVPAVAHERLDLQCDGLQLSEVSGYGRFQLEQMSNNHWWMVFEAGDREVNVWLRASSKIAATFEEDDGEDPTAAAWLAAPIGDV